MKIKQVIPVVTYIDITIEGLKYEGRNCDLVIINCEAFSRTCINATCKKPYFIMGSSFWDASFGKAQTKAIRRICKRAVAKYIIDNDPFGIGG